MWLDFGHSVAAISLEGNTMAKPTIKHWQDPVNLVLGLWLLVSPWVLKYQTETSLMWSAVGLGGLIAVIAALALSKAAAWQVWSSLVLGLCTLVAPWLHEYAPGIPLANAVVIGGAVAALSLWTLTTDKNIGGWWSPAS
jgi:hypothetical protein